MKFKSTWYCFFSLVLLFFLHSFVYGDAVSPGEESSPAPAAVDQADADETPPSGTLGKAAFSCYSLLAQEILFQFSPFNKPIVFGPGLGGSFVYETYILNRIFRTGCSLPGMILGITGSLFAFLTEEESLEFFGDSTLLNTGVYLGYQFYFSSSDAFAFSPALFAGARYYFNFHYYENELHISRNPIIIGGINLNFIINQICDICLSAEYEMYYEAEPGHTLQLALRTGFYY